MRRLLAVARGAMVGVAALRVVHVVGEAIEVLEQHEKRLDDYRARIARLELEMRPLYPEDVFAAVDRERMAAPEEGES